MDNEHKYDINEDEYHLPEAEHEHLFGQQQGPNPQQQARRRKILLGVGLIVVILAAYKLLGLFFGPSTTKQASKPATTTTTTVTKAPLPTPIPVAVKPQAAISEIPTSTLTATPTTTPISSGESDFAQKGIANGQRTEAAGENQVGPASSNLLEMTAKLNQLNERLNEMQVLVKQKQPIVSVRKRINMTETVHKIIIPRPHYFIHAVVPGRAWLVSTDNHTIDQTITVAWGDRIPGYGKVILIDPVKGLVVTNKGAIIHFRNE